MKKNKYIGLLLGLSLFISGCSVSENVSVSYNCNTANITQKDDCYITDETKNNIEMIASHEQSIIDCRKEQEKIEEDKIYEATIIAVGDNLIHMPVLNAGREEDGTYNYTYMYENIIDEISKADLKVINQETILVSDSSKYSSYPTFGSPLAIGDALIDSGFNLITSATNHSYDKGVSGIQDTVNFWKEHKETTMIGIYDNQEDYDKITVINVNGIKIACLNYTYGLNGFILPSDKQYLVKTLYDKEYVKNEIKLASEQSDFVIVFPHWGTEYVYKPSSHQEEWAKIFADSGADLIIGTHPHVVEPLEYIETEDGRQVPCFYSLGNFISGQTEVPRNLGGMASVKISMQHKIVTVDTAELIPIVTHRDYLTKKFQAYFLTDYSDELSKKHYLQRKGKDMSPDTLQILFNNITK